MKENTLLKVALICSITGIVLLFFVSEIMKFPEKQIKDITAKDSETDIWVKGIVDRITEKEKVAYIDIIQPEKITAVVFKEKEALDLKEGEYVEVAGRVEEYNKKLQIIGNIVRKD